MYYKLKDMNIEYYPSNFFELFRRQICKDIAFRRTKDLERNSAVMIFKRRHVIVPIIQTEKVHV